MSLIGQNPSSASERTQQGDGGSGQLMFCLISLDGQSFAIRASAVREVIGSALIVKVPLAPQFMAGVVNHRGAMLTTVSLRGVLGLPSAESSSCVVVMRAERDGGECFGLLVDELTGIVTLDGSTVENIPPTVTDTAQRVLRGMYVRAQGTLVELDAEHLRPEGLAAMAHGGN